MHLCAISFDSFFKAFIDNQLLILSDVLLAIQLSVLRSQETHVRSLRLAHVHTFSPLECVVTFVFTLRALTCLSIVSMYVNAESVEIFL